MGCGASSTNKVATKDGNDEGGGYPELEFGYPGQLGSYMAMHNNVITTHGRIIGEESVLEQIKRVEKKDFLCHECVPPALEKASKPSNHLLLGITANGVMRFVERIGFPSRYKRDEKEMGWCTQVYGPGLTGYDFAYAIRQWLDENGHSDKSVCEVLLAEGDDAVGPAHTFLSHVQSQNLDATVRAMLVAPYVTGGLAKHEGWTVVKEDDMDSDTDNSMEEVMRRGRKRHPQKDSLKTAKTVCNKIEKESQHRVYVTMGAREENEPFDAYAKKTFSSASEGSGRKLVWPKVGVVMPQGNFMPWPTDETSDDFQLLMDNKAIWQPVGLVDKAGAFQSILDDYGYAKSEFEFDKLSRSGFILVFERPSEPRFWLDYFCLRQQVADFDLSSILDAIGDIGSVIVDFHPTPQNYLSRSFCVFEAFSACKKDCELLCFVGSSIFGSTSEMATKAYKIFRELEEVKVECEAAQTRLEEDRAKILAHLKKMGPTAVNDTVKKAMVAGATVCKDLFDEMDH